MLARGTRLRLDGIESAWYCDGRIHQTTDFAFTVLDGDFAGCCVEASDVLLDDHLSHMSDAVETLTGVSLSDIFDSILMNSRPG
jgi:hypothetical protein